MGAGKKVKPRESRHAMFAKVATHRGYIPRFSQATAHHNGSDGAPLEDARL